MRFVFISTMPGGPWGGSEELWSQTALRLLGEGHDVAASVVWWPQLSPKVTNLSKQGIKLYVQPKAQVRWEVSLWRKFKRRMGIQPREFEWLRRQNPDLVVCSQGGFGDSEWTEFCRQAGLPYVIIIQCNHEYWWRSDDAAEELEKTYRAAQKVFCVSRQNLELMKCQFGVALPNASVIWNAMNVAPEPPPAWPPETGVWKLACVARLEPAAKGQDLLFQVLAQPQWRERPVEVNLYGAGDCERNLQRLAGFFQLKNISFRGHVADVRQIWAENHLLVLPSRYEGLPLALVESMWCGRPAVVTDIGGNAEVCEDGQTGFVAAAPTAKLLAEALERAWTQRHDWPAMGQAVWQRAEQLIPQDPVGVFGRLLVECAAKS